jgi:hypothetical protein
MQAALLTPRHRSFSLSREVQVNPRDAGICRDGENRPWMHRNRRQNASIGKAEQSELQTNKSISFVVCA